MKGAETLKIKRVVYQHHVVYIWLKWIRIRKNSAGPIGSGSTIKVPTNKGKEAFAFFVSTLPIILYDCHACVQHCAGQYYFQSSDGEPFTVVNADGPVDDDILSRGPSASPPNSIAGLGPNQVGEKTGSQKPVLRSRSPEPRSRN